MTWRIVWTANAITGIREVVSFQDELQLGRGAVLADAIFDRVGELMEFPESAPAHPGAEDARIRRLVFRKFVIIYRVMTEGKVLQVLAVRHHRQKPLDPGDLP